MERVNEERFEGLVYHQGASIRLERENRKFMCHNLELWFLLFYYLLSSFSVPF
jgi:hypothetical protein